MKFLQLTEKEFISWIQEQLRKREVINGYRFEKRELIYQLYDLLFCEYHLTLDDIEQYLFPFDQSGYLSAKHKFELMLFVVDKDGITDTKFLLDLLECDSVITEEKIESTYLEWAKEDRLILSEEEKVEFYLKNLMEKLGFGVLEVLEDIAAEGVLLGEMCPKRRPGDPEKERIAICREGRLTYLPFLRTEEEEEIRRIITGVIAGENKGELTMMEPVWECVRDDGTCLTAVRPPAGTSWGLRILYSAAGKEQKRWQKL